LSVQPARRGGQLAKGGYPLAGQDIPPAATSTLSYRADIDGMRAVAVLLVLVFHFDLLWKGKAGFIGVDVFFVISGFLITAIVKKQLDEDVFSLRTFYLNRIRRLAPAFFSVLVLSFSVGVLWLFPADLIELSKQIFYSQAYLANFYYWKNVNYFGLNADNVYLLHTWSLAVEEQFYLLYPLALVLVHKYLKRYFWLMLALVLVLSFSLNVFFVKDKPEAVFYLLPTRAWELLAGGLACAVHGHLKLQRLANDFLGLAGFILVFSSVAFFTEEIRFPGFFALLPTLGAVCLLLSGACRETWSSRSLSCAPFVYIGKISYSLYLVHWPVNVFAKMALADGYTLQWRFAMFGLSLVFASIIYHAIENPFRHRRFLATDRRLAAGYFSGLGATALIFMLVLGTGGLPQRFPGKVLALAGHANDRMPLKPECEFVDKTSLVGKDFCLLGSAGKEPEWLIYGDSHAWAAYEVFDKWLKAKGQSGLFMFRNSCPPVRGVHLFRDKGRCFAFNQSIAGFLAANRSIRNVLMVSTWRQAIEARLSTSPDIKLGVKESVSLFEEKFADTLRYQNDLGIKVYIWEPLPGARRNVPVALARAALENQSTDIEITKIEYFATYGFFFDVLKKNRDLVTLSFSPSKALCGSGRCAVSIGDNPVYFDSSHIAKSSTDFWVDMMRRAELKSEK